MRHLPVGILLYASGNGEECGKTKVLCKCRVEEDLNVTSGQTNNKRIPEEYVFESEREIRQK